MSEKKLPAIPEDRQSQLKLLIARGKEQGYLTYAEVNDHLPPEIVDPEQIEDIVNTINDMGITVHEKAPDAESLLLTDASAPDEEAVEEAAAALAIADSEFGRKVGAEKRTTQLRCSDGHTMELEEPRVHAVDTDFAGAPAR